MAAFSLLDRACSSRLHADQGAFWSPCSNQLQMPPVHSRAPRQSAQHTRNSHLLVQIIARSHMWDRCAVQHTCMQKVLSCRDLPHAGTFSRTETFESKHKKTHQCQSRRRRQRGRCSRALDRSVRHLHRNRNRNRNRNRTLCVSCVCANYCTVIFGWGVAAACTPGHAGRQCCTCTAAFEKQHLAFNWDTPRPLLSSSGVCIRACTPSPWVKGPLASGPLLG